MIDGTLICYGSASFSANGESVTIYFPQQFKDSGDSYSFMCTSQYSTASNIILSYANDYKDHIKVFRNPVGNYTEKIKWIAIGRWK